ncbi:L-threonylcarbamoyladenylate synthase [Lacinutrix venerupis]|uniref:L-threonylcarbamoyladenylate synthase n=1 Tax=Lacinutrix venerupis TaxID=1486034 RepID=A0AAC9LN44_9FLAO|nr:L-threonylcarbamoyladenylate synthase [Lacinutrix venerupis]APX99686.1 threonylcarbamoyl-AMP synthase [Lacinutrix venerupis]RLJ62386.1 L-threonylcarbamoyladenylate synthase [Lacinutrix venerupis]
MREEIDKAIAVLKSGGLIVYPTDTVWGIGCDATNAEAVKKVYKLKQRQDNKALICLVNNYSMLEKHVDNVPKMAYTILDIADKPTTIIYDAPAGVAENLIAEDNTLAIRIVDHDFCKKLIRYLGRPIVSTSANIAGKPTPKSFKEIDEAILKGVDYVVNLQQQKNGGNPSTIIKLSNTSGVKIIRE